MLEAYRWARKLELSRLHQNEKPIALLTSMQANQGRDPKRRKTAYKMEDFFLFQPREEADTASARYGSAAMKMIEDGIYPSWALFCFADLTAQADGHPPILLALMAKDALLLGPVEQADGGFKGLLIAEESAGGEARQFTSPCGMAVTLRVPHVPTKTVAQEGVILQRC